MAKFRIGNVMKSRSCGQYTIIDKIGDLCEVRFDTGYSTTVSTKCARDGSVKDPFYPQVLGVGYIGVGEHVSRLGAASKGYGTLPEYNSWINMLQRCYYDKYIGRTKEEKVYENVSVIEEWHNFQNFAEWYVPRRKLFDVYNIYRPALEKDIFAHNNKPKVYSPETCCIVPPEINGAIIKIDSTLSGILKSDKGYYLMHKSKRVEGYYDTIEDAALARMVVKQSNLRFLADKYSHVIEQRVYDKLYNWFEV